jgi:hypothetical protein
LRDAAESRAGDESAAVPLAGPRFRKEEGCARDFQAGGSQREGLALLERLCAQGMAPLLAEPLSTTASAVAEVPFQVATAGCLRAGAVSAGGALSMTLVDPRGSVLSAASSTEPVAVVPIDGTLCVRVPGTYRAAVRLSGGASQVTVQIWQAYRD